MSIKRLADFEIIELILSDDKKIPSEFIAVKFGKNMVTIDGKEFEFEFTDNDADNIIAEFARRGKDLVVDYEHQTTSGQKAPAAGWVKQLKKTDQGLVAIMNYWTDTAKEHLEKGEYRYMSPVIKGSRSMKNWTILHSIALTNHPALHKYEALVASDESADADEDNNINKDKEMNELIKKLQAAFSTLQLSDDSTDENIVKEIEALITDAKKASDEFLQLHDSKSFDEMTLKIQGMVSGEELTKLQAEITKRDAEKAVSLALSDGKITAAKKDWAIKFANRDLVAFNDLMIDAPVVVPTGAPVQKPVEAKEETTAFSFSDAEMKVYQAMGFSDEIIEEMRKEKEEAK